MSTRWCLTLGLAGVLALAGCTTSSDETTAPSPTPTVTASPQPTRQALTARERAQQLTALGPESFDATYRLTSRGPRPDPLVRMRVKGERFRLDVTQGRTTATLLYGPRGVVSCQVIDRKQGRMDKSCFLVSATPKGLPELFDPQVQQLFRSTSRALASGGKGLRIQRADPWRAPNGLGPAECFDIKGPAVDDGTYCYLSRPAPSIGLLAKAMFPSGRMEIRDVSRVQREGLFRPPVRPTPLPD
jgi:hypothetical protein